MGDPKRKKSKCLEEKQKALLVITDQQGLQMINKLEKY